MKTTANTNSFRSLLLVAAILVSGFFSVTAQNPIIHNQFTADPSARVFGDSVYLYPSHDILPPEGEGRAGWFNMADYHVFSSANLTNWTDHGVIVSQNKVKWVDSTSYSMWAPDCIYRNGKYYFYFPSRTADTTKGKGFAIGVAIADKPYGPFTPQTEPIQNVHGIDPNPFIDNDGQAYLYWASREIFVAKLKDNMIELASDPMVIDNLPQKGLKEGPYLFERNGIYYLTYPHVANKIERLEYATADNPMGPFKVTGVIMDETPMGTWTNHQSILKYRGQWYLFYHQSAYSPTFDKNRSACIDSLFFNEDGTIQKVTPTLRGVGLTNASDKIQIDRYSSKSNKGVTDVFLDTLDTFKGWKAVFSSAGAWVQYNAVDFGNKQFNTVSVRAESNTGNTIEIRLGAANGPVVATVQVPAGNDLKIVEASVSGLKKGVQNLVVVLKNNNPVAVDWVSFE